MRKGSREYKKKIKQLYALHYFKFSDILRCRLYGKLEFLIKRPAPSQDAGRFYQVAMRAGCGGINFSTDTTGALVVVMSICEIGGNSLCRNAIFVKMLWGDVDGASKPGYGPTVKADAFKHRLVAQGSEDCILLYQGQAVEDATASVVEGETEPVVVKRLGSCDPFEFIVLSHRNSVKGVNGCESLAVFHPVPIGHQLVLVLV